MIAASIDISQASNMFRELRDAMIAKGGDASSLLKRQTRLLCRQLAIDTPPILASGQGSVGTDAQKSGEDAINRELNRVFFGVSQAQVTEARAVNVSGVASKTLWADKSGQVYGVEDVLFMPDATSEQLATVHNAARLSNGKVSLAGAFTRNIGRWKFVNRAVTLQSIKDDYIKTVFAKLGRFKATWAVSGADLGDEKYPSWITRHFGRLGNMTFLNRQHMDDPVKGFVIVGTRAPGCGEAKYKNKVRHAVEVRMMKIRQEIKLILSDYKDWRTVRAKSEARRRQ